jgi:hypothetical protein
MAQRLNVVGSAVLVLVSLAGCARINDMGRRLTASSMKAVAVVNETLLVGDATIMLDRTGRLNLAATNPPGLTCRGEMHYTATRTGVVDLRCSDGTDTRLVFGALSDMSGYGSGRNERGPITFTFGVDPAEAAAYLTLPADKHMVSSYEGGSRLEPLSTPGVTP